MGTEIGLLSDSRINGISNSGLVIASDKIIATEHKIYLRTMESDLMRPVPVVFLLLA